MSRVILASFLPFICIIIVHPVLAFEPKDTILLKELLDTHTTQINSSAYSSDDQKIYFSQKADIFKQIDDGYTLSIGTLRTIKFSVDQEGFDISDLANRQSLFEYLKNASPKAMAGLRSDQSMSAEKMNNLAKEIGLHGTLANNQPLYRALIMLIIQEAEEARLSKKVLVMTGGKFTIIEPNRDKIIFASYDPANKIPLASKRGNSIVFFFLFFISGLLVDLLQKKIRALFRKQKEEDPNKKEGNEKLSDAIIKAYTNLKMDIQSLNSGFAIGTLTLSHILKRLDQEFNVTMERTWENTAKSSNPSAANEDEIKYKKAFETYESSPHSLLDINVLIKDLGLSNVDLSKHDDYKYKKAFIAYENSAHSPQAINLLLKELELPKADLSNQKNQKYKKEFKVYESSSHSSQDADLLLTALGLPNINPSEYPEILPEEQQMLEPEMDLYFQAAEKRYGDFLNEIKSKPPEDPGSILWFNQQVIEMALLFLDLIERHTKRSAVDEPYVKASIAYLNANQERSGFLCEHKTVMEIPVWIHRLIEFANKTGIKNLDKILFRGYLLDTEAMQTLSYEPDYLQRFKINH